MRYHAFTLTRRSLISYRTRHRTDIVARFSIPTLIAIAHGLGGTLLHQPSRPLILCHHRNLPSNHSSVPHRGRPPAGAATHHNMDKTLSGYKPFMRVESQSRIGSAHTRSYQAVIPNSFNHKNVAFPTSASAPPWHGPLPRPRDSGVNASPPPASRAASLDVESEPAFVHSTLQTMKSRLTPTWRASGSERSPDGHQDVPPAKRRRIHGVSSTRKLILRPTQPVKNSEQVSFDIWQNILALSEPKFLLEARTINSAFYQMLSDRPGIWRESRRHYFGQDMPDCPRGLTEQQYVDLLVGRGCQNRTCVKEHTAKVYWPFLVRLCAHCLKQKTMRPGDLPPSRRYSLHQKNDGAPSEDTRSLWSLIPQACSTGGRYVQARPVTPAGTDWATSGPYFIFLKSSYLKREAEYLEFVNAHADADTIKQWSDRVHASNIEYMQHVGRIESWMRTRTSSSLDLRMARSLFFTARAAELSPPMDLTVLYKMAAYNKALRVPSPPTSRSWETLKEKILPYRPQAEALVRYHTEMNVPSASPRVEIFRRLHKHRFGRRCESLRLQPEQEFVLQLGEKELEKCLRAGVADADLVLLCLTNVFESYERLDERPHGLNYDGVHGPYRLTLDDARMIVEEVIEEHIPRFSQRGAVVFDELRCIGCARTDFIKKWSFVEGFEHVLAAHAQVVGDGLEFWRFATPYSRECEYHTHYFRFPWYTVPWPRCLPLLPGHRDVADAPSWHPDAHMPYVPLKPAGTQSAFDRRSPCESGLDRDDFAGHLLYAAKVLNGVRLSGPCQMKVALQYALDRYAQATTAEPPLSSFLRALETIPDANPGIELKFRCGACVREGKVYRSARQVKYAITMEQLRTHWDEKHREQAQGGNACWTKDLMHLPSDTEVLDLILEADKKLQEEKDTAQARNAALSTSSKKRPSLKRNVVMGTTPAMEIFGRLFLIQG